MKKTLLGILLLCNLTFADVDPFEASKIAYAQQDYKTAAYHLKQVLSPTAESTSKMLPDDIYQLGVLFELAEDYTESQQWYEVAAQHDHPLAKRQLIYFYYAGRGGEQDHLKVKTLLEDLLFIPNMNDKGNLTYLYATLFKDDKGIPPDYPKAIQWLEVAAQKHNNALAYYDLGLLLIEGKHMPQNCALGQQYFQEAAKSLPAAIAMDGYLYKTGCGEIKPDAQKATELFQQACEQGARQGCAELK